MEKTLSEKMRRNKQIFAFAILFIAIVLTAFWGLAIGNLGVSEGPSRKKVCERKCSPHKGKVERVYQDWTSSEYMCYCINQSTVTESYQIIGGNNLREVDEE